jgi:hypothetical protein
MTTSSSTKYIIQWQTDPQFCIGVTAIAAGANVTLSTLAGAGNPQTQWTMDPNTGLIALAASPDLVLDISGNYIGNGTPLVLANYVIGRPQQQWNWVGTPKAVMSLGQPGMCADNSGGAHKPGNQIVLWSYGAGNTNQAWSFLPVPALERLGGVQERSTSLVGAGA